MSQRLQPRRSDAIALLLWVAGAALFVTGTLVGSDESCEVADHGRYVVKAHRAGIALLTAAVVVAAAAVFLAADAFGDRSTRSKVWHSLASVLSFAPVGFLALIGLFELVTFGSPVWSPDGKKIAIFAARHSTRGTYVMDADGGHLAFLTSTDGRAGSYVRTADAAWLSPSRDEASRAR